MTDDTLFQFLLDEASYPFVGWDFSYIEDTGRVAHAPLTWSYISIILPKMRQAEALLDMGTGGGELLSRLRPFPKLTCATEGYAPNIPVAQERLTPLGVQVYPVTDDKHLPLPDTTFDLVINRHESYDPAEVRRVLKPGGEFVTQQVGGTNDRDLNRLLGAKLNSDFDHWTLAYARKEVEAAGFEIIAAHEDFPIMRIFDVGAVVYYLKAIPWQIEDFSVESYFDQLLALHQTIQQQGYVDLHDHRFLIVARKN
ncbi:MAG TPA: class I SAM-dependent methyltransferase [Phototrophicaceae bacterium]|nr:class I SAM-dependent methyltransferase [Phototrophicaceae bacterium]